MLRAIAVAVFSVSVLGSTFVFAHHGGSMYPNRDDESILEDAVVGEFLFVNPHARLLFSWTDLFSFFNWTVFFCCVCGGGGVRPTQN